MQAMPELPEVETVARTLAPHVEGWRFAAVQVLHKPTLHPQGLPPQSLVGQVVSRVARRGKLLLLHLNSQDDGQDGQQHGRKPATAYAGGKPTILAVHLRMTGALLPHAAGPDDTPPACGPHTRCVFTLERAGQRQWLFFDDIRTFGKIMPATEPLLQQWPFWRNLGPEPLDISVADFAARLRGKRAIKAVLLDQTVLAGIGNIYADESLFAARIDPRRPADSLTGQMTARLHEAMQAVLTKAIAQCGTSFRNYRDANGDAGAFQNELLVYGKGGAPCPACGKALTKATVAGRSTVFCPRCQK